MNATKTSSKPDMSKKPTIKKPKTMLDPLPERLPAGRTYTVPKEIKSDPGDLFAYICAICYGKDDVLLLAEYFKVTRQTFWIWRKHGKGVPDAYREAVEALIESEEPPADLFRMPRNATVDHIMREPRGQNVPARLAPSQNHNLIELLNRVCNSEDFGHSSLKTMIRQMSRPVSNPYVFYRWAWANGGVPRSYLSAFITALMQLKVWELYGYSEGNRVQWEGWAESNLAAPHDYDDDDD